MTITITKWKLALGVLVVALLAPATALATHVFSDVPDDKFYAGPVEWAKTNNITTGKSPTIFDPDGNVTRGESVTFLKRYNDNIVVPADAALQTSVNTNTTNIATNTANITTNTGNITTNTGNIATNTANIATNTSNITTNTASLAAGYTTGRLGIVGFGAANTPQTVGSLNLPAGNYIVNAAVVANNNDGAVRNVGCQLQLDATIIGAMFDTALFPISTTGAGGERESIALTGGGTLAAAGTANVVCQTNATSGNYLDLTITAIKVSALTDTSAGPLASSPAGPASSEG